MSSASCSTSSSGSGEVRLDDRTLPVRAGDLIASPAGAEAHQIINTGKDELRYLAISDMNTVDVIDYPDSKKMGVAAGVKNGDLSTATYKAFGRVTPADYFDGEEPVRRARREARNRLSVKKPIAALRTAPWRASPERFFQSACNRLAWLRRQIAW